MVTSAQLDNDKSTLSYQVELLKDKLEEMQESHTQLQVTPGPGVKGLAVADAHRTGSSAPSRVSAEDEKLTVLLEYSDAKNNYD